MEVANCCRSHGQVAVGGMGNFYIDAGYASFSFVASFIVILEAGCYVCPWEADVASMFIYIQGFP